MDHKKLLIIHASAGHGHEKAAKAIAEGVKLKNFPIDIEIVDVIDYLPKWFGIIYKESYLIQIKHFPYLWGNFYFTFDSPLILPLMKVVRRIMNGLAAHKLQAHIVQKNPHFIACTHFMGTEVTSHLKRSGKITSKILTMITDYLPHQVWMAEGLSAYLVGAPQTRDELVKRKVPANLIHVVGIPVEQKFFFPLDSAALRQSFDLEPKILTILVTSGGVGVGTMGQIVEGLVKLGKPIQILAVCGTNESLFNTLSAVKASYNKLKVFGFVNNMHELMEMADLVIGKGGGLTIAECLAKEKPVILFKSIPGQESRNAQCIVEYKAGFATNSAEEVCQSVLEVLEKPESLSILKEGVKTMRRDNPAMTIAEIIQHERF